MGRRFINDEPDAYPEYHNPYYHPEKCGLTLVAELKDSEACYSFKTQLLWQDNETGAFYTAYDAGCSCPTPFEEITGIDDLELVPSLAYLHEVLDRRMIDGWQSGRAAFIDQAREAGLK